MLQKGVDALAKRAAGMVMDQTRKKAITVLENSDFEILQQLLERLQNDTEKLASMFTKQAKAVLTSSYSHAERGLIIIRVSSFY